MMKKDPSSSSWARCCARPRTGSRSTWQWPSWRSGCKGCRPRPATWPRPCAAWPAAPGRREEVEERFQLLRRLETKYGKGIDDLIAYRAGLDEQEKRLQGAEDEREAIEGEMAKVFTELRRAGAELSKQREKVARRFVNEVRKHLADLGMADAQLDAA